ncbi:MAG: winged helix-turn-helix domain-containing protein [Pseudomonadota bacterium]
MSNAMVYTAGSLRVDVQDERVFLNDVPVPLGHKSFALLLALLQSPQRMLTKDELIEAVWDGRAVSDGVLTTAMRELRQALNDNARHPHFIQTVHGRGYRFLLDVEATALAPIPLASKLQADTGSLAPDPDRKTSSWLAWPVGALVVGALAVFGPMSVQSTLQKHSESDSFAMNETLNSVIVVPFSDLSPNGSDDWFAGGLTQELLTSLGQVSDLDVIGVDRAALSEVGSINGAQLAQDLGIESAVEGSVRRDNGRIRVTVQLSRAEDGVVIWSEAYDRADSEIISIQEDLAFELANSLNTVADADLLRAMSGAGTSSVEAYQAMLSGHFFLSQQYATGDASYRRLAYDEYERARQIDPEFSEAHWLAARYWLERSTYLVKSTAALDAFLTEVALQLRYSSISDLMLDEIKTIENQGDKWWFGGDLNSRPHDYESCALTS